MDTLPAETFQLICSFCSLHVLSCLRLVSKDFRDLVDDSLTARRSHAIPISTILPKGNHDRSACYVRVTLKPQGAPVTVVFNRYSLQHNYLEFVQKTAAAPIESLGVASNDKSTLGELDFNLWDEQQNEAASMEHRIEQELASSGPITPLPHVRPVRNALMSTSGTSSASSSSTTPVSSLPRDNTVQGTSYILRIAQMVLSSTGAGPQSDRTRSRTMDRQLRKAAHQLIHTGEPKKPYKFNLSLGVHYISDNDFIMRYSILRDPNPNASLLFVVDYIRVSWKWISSGAPAMMKSRPSEGQLPTHLADPMAQEDPFPEQRIGRIYAERFNMLLREIQRQEISHYVRGGLAFDGYDKTVLPRNFIWVNLRSEPVVSWITRIDDNGRRARQQKENEESSSDRRELRGDKSLSQDEPQYAEDESGHTSDSDWEDVLPQNKSSTSNSNISTENRDSEDRRRLEEVVQGMKSNMGYLTVRNIIEEMLVKEGYSRDLIWKYGIARRVLMDPILEMEDANEVNDGKKVKDVKIVKKLLQTLLDSEAAS
ncbi:hypothetical protein BGX27_008933 [Mortierella sp. AM989]|nr:hypothetical protein BGX27_008933 [Mortierella sp. AM989]